jgi:hypothetical protein
MIDELKKRLLNPLDKDMAQAKGQKADMSKTFNNSSAIFK